MRLIVRDDREVTAAERAACDDLWTRTWPPTPGEAPDPAEEHRAIVRILLVGEDGGLRGACELIERTITVDGAPVAIAGLGGVVVEEARRGRGLGSRLVRAAMDAARARGYDFALLFCDAERRAFYARLGWRLLTGPITATYSGEERPVEDGALVMAAPLTPAAERRWPAWAAARLYLGIGQW
ncbi:MAG TPA: GNAT family N-acetyltransferase [Thermomicrobiales bacterium]|nr:GNAT family N-acetyltransferase [Thermomicrobiales bacterium]